MLSKAQHRTLQAISQILNANDEFAVKISKPTHLKFFYGCMANLHLHPLKNPNRCEIYHTLSVWESERFLGFWGIGLLYLLKSIYNWVVFHPLNTINNQGEFSGPEFFYSSPVQNRFSQRNVTGQEWQIFQ